MIYSFLRASNPFIKQLSNFSTLKDSSEGEEDEEHGVKASFSQPADDDYEDEDSPGEDDSYDLSDEDTPHIASIDAFQMEITPKGVHRSLRGDVSQTLQLVLTQSGLQQRQRHFPMKRQKIQVEMDKNGAKMKEMEAASIEDRNLPLKNPTSVGRLPLPSTVGLEHSGRNLDRTPLRIVGLDRPHALGLYWCTT
ncbi:hypothetical protein M9H77_12035 [Catharanthus roseus]|uniref:Uncharacterized protein n=1 Tax=Catharanthus roseus TaxID=4058 RepID=A0ACC0BG79_CATRO|nr:hypothetical protein M9H77_12035 [Catharanthus roseus]